MACKPDAATIADPIREHKLQTTELASGTYTCAFGARLSVATMHPPMPTKTG